MKLIHEYAGKRIRKYHGRCWLEYATQLGWGTGSWNKAHIRHDIVGFRVAGGLP